MARTKTPVVDLNFTPERVKRIRKANDMTQEEFAAAIGSDQTSISMWENGVRSPNLRKHLEQLIALEGSA